MRKTSLYPKLASQNIRLNRQFYLPYIITCVATIAMFYIMGYLAFGQGAATLHGLLVVILRLGMIVIGLFSTVFLFYTNSFLMKRRQKELGLYNILGMGKGNIAGILFFETIFVALGTIAIGLGLGILLSKLILLALCKLVVFSVPFGFEIPLPAVFWTLGLFGGIFLLILISNLIRIKLSKPIELLHGSSVGEKEPKVKWVLAVLGILTLGAGYYIAIVTESPLSAIFLFFVAVILVIIGTYLLFTASSIAVLKRLKANPGFYYKTRHFIPVSGMLYRMKQNAVGLANICILSTMVLVMVSGTVCLYLGTEDSLIASYPSEYAVEVSGLSGNARENISSMVMQAVDNSGYTPSNVQDYISINGMALRKGSELHIYGNSIYDSSATGIITIMSAEEYSNYSGEKVTLNHGEALLQSSVSGFGDKVSLDGTSFTVVGDVSTAPKNALGSAITSAVESYCVVLSDTDFDAFCASYENARPEWYYGFDVEGLNSEEKLALYEKVSNVAYSADSDSIDGGFYRLGFTSREENRGFVYEMNGGFLFLGIFLGIIFLMATVLIIYYKQLSEGYEDRQRFEIMQKVGLSKPEIKKAIRSQILVVFFLPLGMAVIHIAFAFKMITKLLLVMGLTNTGLFAICTLGTVGVFAIIYALVYSLTAKTYYRVVE